MLPELITSSCTLYNLWEENDELCYMTTVLSSIAWQGGYGAKLAMQGVQTLDKIAVIIPFGIYDGKAYIPAEEWRQMCCKERGKFWTLAKGDRIVHGPPQHIHRIQDLKNAFTITEFFNNDFGTEEMRHFKVIGK